MAITTIDGASAGFRYPIDIVKVISSMSTAVPFSTFYTAALPVAAAAPAPGINGAALTTYTGQFPFTNPVSGNSHVGRFQMSSSSTYGQALILDRLWHNSGLDVTSTSPQAITTPSWPARDANGSANGDSVYIGVEISGAVGAGTPTLTVDYTNSAGTAGRTGTNIHPTLASSVVGSFYPIGLDAGDVGVRSIQNFTLSATWTSGTIHLVAYRVLARLDLSVAPTRANALDWVTGGAIRMYDNSVPFMVVVAPANSGTYIGHFAATQG